MATPDEQTEKALAEVDWKEIAVKLFPFTLMLMTEKKITSLPDGMDHEDVVLLAIQKVITGQRSWNPEKYPNLVAHMKWIIKSDLSDHGYLGKNRDKEPLYTDDDQLLEDLYGGGLCEGFDDDSFLPALYAEIEGEETLEIIVLAIVEGAIAPAAVAKDTGIPIDEVYIARRKLQRRINAAKAKMAELAEGTQ